MESLWFIPLKQSNPSKMPAESCTIEVTILMLY